MNRYKVTKVLGDGTYGSVVRAQNKQTEENVAIKKLKEKYYNWEDCMKLPEINSLRKLIHPNIVKLKEVIRENDQLHMVFECMEANLYELMKGRTKKFPEAKIRNMMFQTMQAMHHCHKNGYFHRDMKPENLLVSSQGSEHLVKLADFGLAREIRARPPFTDYVSTRWYRAPEVLLRSPVYNSPIDQFACGGIMAELYTLRPLFPGSSESDQLYKICSVLGTPSQDNWPDGHKLASKIGFRFPTFSPTSLEQLIPNASPEGVAIMNGMMAWDPNKRLSAAKTLAHAYFEAGAMPTPQEAEGSRLPQLPPVERGRPAMPSGSVQRALNATLGSNREGTGLPSTGRKSVAGSHRGAPPVLGAPSLPPLPTGGSHASGAKSPGGRYLRMARYQPGMEQTPALPNVNKPKNMMPGGPMPGGPAPRNAFEAMGGARKDFRKPSAALSAVK